jgi:hypothetical protein
MTREGLCDPAFAWPNEINVSALDYGDNHGGKAETVTNELATPVQLKSDFLRRHAIDALYVGHEPSRVLVGGAQESSSIAWTGMFLSRDCELKLLD